MKASFSRFLNSLNNDPYIRILNTLSEAGIGKQVDVTSLLLTLFEYNEFEGTIIGQKDAIEWFLKEMQKNEHVEVATIDAIPSNDRRYILNITIPGLEFVNKINDRDRWLLTTFLTLFSLAIGFVNLIYTLFFKS